MSHIVSIKTAFKSTDALKKATAKLGIECEIAEKGKTLTRKLYASQSATGVAAFQLPGWRFPAVVQEDGSCKADNYNGAWGKQEEMDKLACEYSAQLAAMTMKRQGYRSVSDKVEADGTRELVFVS